MIKKHNICVVTGGRADYGPLRPVLRRLSASNTLALTIVAADMHISEAFGSTADCILEDGFIIDDYVELLPTKDSDADIARAVGEGVTEFARCFEALKPTAVLVLGDRYEIFAAASAATLMRLPIIHLCGGDVTEGAIDDVLRHAVTKMAHIHFPSNSYSADRICRMGEAPARIKTVGSPSIDSIVNFDFLCRSEIEARLNFAFRKRNYLITFHSVTLEEDHGADELNSLLAVLTTFDENTGMIFTMPNADAGGRAIAATVQHFVKKAENRVIKANFGQDLYISTMREVDAVVGNSSSGLSEAPSVKTATINIGRRQTNRLRGPSVIDCPAEANEIKTAFRLAAELPLNAFKNPYGDGNAAPKIVSTLESISDFRALLNKSFYESSIK